MTDRTTPTRKALPPPPIGSPGLYTVGGFVLDETDPRFKGPKGTRAIREAVDGDPTVGAITFAMESLIRQAGYDVTAADDTPEAGEIRDFVEEAILDMDGNWGDTLSAIILCCWYGFSLFEVVFKQRNGYNDNPALDSMYDDGRIGWKRWAERAQETVYRWEFDQTTWEATAAVQFAPPVWRMVTIPLDRCLLFHARQSKQNPEGSSLLRNALDSIYYKKNIQRIEAIGIERDFGGVLVIDLPDEVMEDAANLGKWTKILTDFRRNEQDGLAIPSSRDEAGNRLYDVRLLSTPGARSIDTTAVMARYERLILRSVLADFLTLGDQGVGSHAQSRNRSDLFVTAISSFLDTIADTINTQAIRKLVRLNGMPMDLCPAFQFRPISKRETLAFAQTLDLLIKDGILNPSDPELVNWICEELDIPIPAQTSDQAAQAEVAAGTVPGNQDAAQAAVADQPTPVAAQPAAVPAAVPVAAA